LEPGATPQYYPLVFTSFWVEYRLWDLHPAGYHLVNLLLHAASALLLYRILHRLQLPGAALAAALFALHPVHVESVAWITERKNVLSGLFYLAAALAWLRFAGVGASGDVDASAPATRWPGFILSFGLYVCALLSKTVTCSLPAALLLVLWWKHGRWSRRDWLTLVPMLLVGLLAGLATAALEREHVGAEGREWALSPLHRTLIAGRALCFYLAKLLWPHPLVFIYPRWGIDPARPEPYLWPLLVLAALIALWLARRRIGRGPLTAALFFAGTLLPALGFINVYPMRFSFVADHFQYLASLGPLTLAATLLARAPRARLPLALALLATLATLTWRQCHTYADQETLWNSTLRHNPDAWMAHNNLGLVLAARGQTDEAIDHLQQALALDPGYAFAHNNLAMLLLQRGRPDEARHHLEQAVTLRPAYSDAHSNLGIVLAGLGRSEEAIASLREAIRLSPLTFKAHYNLGHLFLTLGRPAEAAAALEQARRILPGDQRVADALRQLGKQRHGRP
jgi:tetratricopeptide (TPR) repeat protein